MATLTELTAEIVSAHASGTSLSSEELIKNIQSVFSTLKSLESGESIPVTDSTVVEAPTAPVITVKQAFKKDEVICMICGRGGFTTLKRHLTVTHDIKPNAYRKQFGIPATQSLAAKSYVESRRQLALDKGLGAGLAKFRADKKESADAKNAAVAEANINVPVQAVKVKAPVPAVKKKAEVPAKIETASTPVKAKKAPLVKSPVKAKK